MIPPPVPAPAVLTAAQERDLARAIRAGRRARLLAQRHLAARLRRDLPPRRLRARRRRRRPRRPPPPPAPRPGRPPRRRRPPLAPCPRRRRPRAPPR